LAHMKVVVHLRKSLVYLTATSLLPIYWLTVTALLMFMSDFSACCGQECSSEGHKSKQS
jgi:hypothetical protein